MLGIRVSGAVVLWFIFLTFVASISPQHFSVVAAGLDSAAAQAQPAPVLEYRGSIGGGVETIEVIGTLAYINEGRTFSIIDVADPVRPVALGSYIASDHIEAIAVVGRHAYVGTRGGVLILDVATPTAPVLVADFVPAGSTWIKDIQVEQSRAYVLSVNGGVTVFDVSNPARPTGLGASIVRYTGVEMAIKVVDGIVYYAPGDDLGQLWRLDAHAPDNITLLPSPTSGMAFFQDVDVVGKYAFVASGSDGLVVLDNTQPVNNLSAFFNIGIGARAIDVSGTLAYLTSDSRVGEFGIAAGEHAIIDVSDPTEPGLLGRFDTPGTGEDIVVAGSRAYVADGPGGLRIFDVSSPTAVRPLGVYRNWHAAAVDAQGDHAFVAAKTDGVKIIDVSNPRRPIVVSSYATTGSAVDLQVAGNLLYVVEWNVENSDTGVWSGGGLSILDVSRPSAPRLLTKYDEIRYLWDIHVENQRAYLASYDGFFILDVTDPYVPDLVSSWSTPGSESEFEDVAIDNDRAYLTRSDWESSLTILDLSDERVPRLLAVHNGADLRDIKVKDGFAFLTGYKDYADRLLILDVRNPLAAGELAAIDGALSDPAELELKGDFAFVPTVSSVQAHGELGLFDVSDPTNPKLVSSYDVQARIRDSAVANGRLLLAADNGGLIILQTDLPADAPIPSPTAPSLPAPSQPAPTPTTSPGTRQYRVLVPLAGR